MLMHFLMVAISRLGMDHSHPALKVPLLKVTLLHCIIHLPHNFTTSQPQRNGFPSLLAFTLPS